MIFVILILKVANGAEQLGFASRNGLEVNHWLSMDGKIMIHTGFHDVTGRLRLLLSESPIAEIRKIRVEQEGDTVMLDGRVRSFYAKQMAQETIRGATSGLQINNRVRVEDAVSQA